MMTPERSRSAVAMLTVLREDIAADIRASEGQAFNGPNVAHALGNLAAQVDALAHVLVDLLTEPTAITIREMPLPSMTP